MTSDVVPVQSSLKSLDSPKSISMSSNVAATAVTGSSNCSVTVTSSASIGNSGATVVRLPTGGSLST